MSRPRSKVPQLRYHISGQSVVSLDGKDFYLGKHDSAASIARYAVLICEYQAGGLSLPEGFDQETLYLRAKALETMPDALVASHQANMPILLKHVTAAFRLRVEKRYADQVQESHRFNQVCNAMDEHDGHLLASKYGPMALQRQRQRWIDSGKARVYCNRLTNAIVRIFKFGVSQELVEESVWRSLKSIDPLRIGDSEAHETEPVGPVPIEWVRATAKELSPVLRSMMRVHVCTGMRPSELCRMRPCDLDRSGEVWMYRPAKHKTASRGKSKAVPIMGDAREAITDYLNRDPMSFRFSPIESYAWYQAKKRTNRKTKIQPSQVSREVENPRKKPRECFDANSYRQSLQRAAKNAKVPHWHPYQLRHLAGTVVREALGPEATQALLGHANIKMSEHYAKVSEAKAIEAAKHAPTLFVKGGEA